MKRTHSSFADLAAAVVMALMLGISTPASAGTIYDFFISSSEGLVNLDEVVVRSYVQPDDTEVLGYATLDPKTETGAFVQPDMFDFSDGTSIGIASVGITPVKLPALFEVPVVGRHRLTQRHTELRDANLNYLGDSSSFAIQTGFKGKKKVQLLRGVVSQTTINVSAALKLSGDDNVTNKQNGKLKIRIAKLHSGSSRIEANAISFTVVDGLFLGASPLQNPKSGQWRGSALFASGYPLILKGVPDTDSGGAFKLSIKPNRNEKSGTFNLSAKQGRRKYSEKGLIDISANELDSQDNPQTIFTSFDTFSLQRSFSSPASRETFKVRIQK